MNENEISWVARLLHIPLVLNAVTGVIWFYRYIWFTQETIPMDRIIWWFGATVIFFILSAILESDDDKKKDY